MSFADKLYTLRKKEKMTQEEFAELFNVSRQAVQKWESGVSLPEICKVVEIAKYFGISIDNLILERPSRMSEELTFTKDVIPGFDKIPIWEFYPAEVMVEYKQSLDEGLDVEQYKMLFEAIHRLPQNIIKKELGDIVQKIIMNAPYRSDYKYTEPSELNEIKKLRKKFVLPTNEISNMKDKIYGAWFGRICGCMLGKSVEGIRTPELIDILKKTDNFPMKRYISAEDINSLDISKYEYDLKHRIFAGDTDYAPADDDTNYTVMAQMIFDEYGADFTPENVAAAWIKYQSKEAYCTAERVAFCNFIKGYCPPQSAIYKNPYREWIGAQIRADYWGYINPGNPEKAAEMAWRDASISHVKNGIYGEMFVASMLSVAAITNNIETIILSGLSQIPSTSRLYEDIMQIVDGYKNGKSQKEVFKHIHSRYDEYVGHDWCHTNSNAMIVAASLLYGNGNYGKSVCMSVETGFDTDCNGATVGSILGMANGAESIDRVWTEPFNDTLETSIFGVGKISISELAEKTLLHIKRMNENIQI